ncbi:MAG TPA: alpha-amylase/4-alpha-glucanotransferase domain-containing protein [Candidatus Limnocylindrales bacterium]|nr:alpha-amylase/4-alpha-glucanotransferase domain-containing protein [Candidatus Limnocylindrales bacterium]
MAPRISLALALHNHQPVGNFGWVFAEVFEKAYAPMVDALERHPQVRLSLHYTGPLLGWLIAERGDTVERLRALVERDQVEILGGGYFEPVLVALPERDRVGQLRRMGDELEALFGRRPRGAWLAERVWEPDLPTSLVAAGYDWTILDDAHFRAAAIPEDDLWGPYTTDDQGHLLRVFGTEQGLRYRIPFREVDDVIDYLRAHATEAGDRVGVMGDDGEKFGGWPTTWEHCWGERQWVERFFTALEANADWLSTTTPSAWLEDHAPVGRVYIPTGSYAEMGAWALPADEGLQFTRILHRAQEERLPEARWLRGASWRNFQVKYREVNDLHKRMLSISDAVAAMPEEPDRGRALVHLYQGQSNDAYWHGLFGGVYISHMRLATWEHLIGAEDLAEAATGSTVCAELRDIDLDGIHEVRLSDAGQVVTVDLAEGAGIGSWDIRSVRHALAAVLRRRPEAYHAQVRALDPGGDGAGEGDGNDETDAPASIHETVRAKETGLAERLVYDRYERRSGLIRVLPADVAAEDWAAAGTEDLGDLVDGAYTVDALEHGRLVVRRETTIGQARVAATKALSLGGDRRAPTLSIEIEIEHLGGPPLDARVGIEISLTMLGGGGNPAAWWDVGGGRVAHDTSGSAAGISTVAQGNDDIGVSVSSTTSDADAWFAPIETVSNSEDGFERVYQGSGLLLSWPVHLEPGERWSRSIGNTVTTTRDRAVEEIQPVESPAETAEGAPIGASSAGNPSARGLRATG